MTRTATGPDDRGFTLIELLVVMIIIGILAAIAIPAFLTQKRKAHETAAKSDVKQIVKEVVGYYIDDDKALTLTGTTGTWTLTDTASTVVATGPLSTGNSVATSSITNGNAYCVSVAPSADGARTWHASQDGLAAGGC